MGIGGVMVSRDSCEDIAPGPGQQLAGCPESGFVCLLSLGSRGTGFPDACIGEWFLAGNELNV